MRIKIFLPLGVLILVLVTALSAWSIYQLGAAIQVERKSKMVESSAQTLFRYLQEAESAQRKFLLTAKRDYMKSLDVVVPKIPKTLERLNQLVDGNSDQEERIGTLEELVELKLEELRIPDGLPETERGRLALAVQKTEKEEGLMHEIHTVLDEVDQAAKQDARVHEAFAHKYTTFLIAAITAASALAIFLVIAFGVLSRRELEMRIRTEKELKEAQEAAMIASRLKSQFLATVSHEIRTPLNGIIGMSDLLRQKVKNPEQQRFLQVICDSGESLLRMVNDILDFAKIEARKIQIELTEFSILRTVEQVTELFSFKAEEKGIALATYVDPRIPTTVAADGARVSQILGNLVGNAVKFTSRGGVLVTARLAMLTDATAHLRFEVEDSGPGIDPSLQSLLFQPFNSFNAGGRKFEGSGLGLSICKNLVEQMNGTIGLTSRPGEGTTFWFELPVQVAAKATIGELHAPAASWSSVSISGESPVLERVLKSYSEELVLTQKSLEAALTGNDSPKALIFAHADSAYAQPVSRLAERLKRFPEARLILITSESQKDWSVPVAGPSVLGILRMPFSREQILSLIGATPLPGGVESQAPLKTAGGGKFILLVEDNATNQILARAILEDLGYRVHAVANGEESLEALSRVEYDAVLMDCQMPVMDGYEATRRIRVSESTTGRHTPIIAMTANASDADRQKCLSAGMDDFLAKPFKSAELLAKLEIWIGSMTLGDGVDWTVLRDLGRQTSSAVVDRLIASFLTTLPQVLVQMESAAKAENAEAVRRFAHHLKASASSLGARRLAELCERVEHQAKSSGSEDWQDGVEALLACGRSVEVEIKKNYLAAETSR